MIEGDYIISIKTVRGECKIGRRYKILGIDKKGENISFLDEFELILEDDYYFITHNGNMTLSSCVNFKYDYEYNRKIKLKKLKKYGNRYNK